ncbi:MAG: hypothetical protein NTX48_16980, partial [Planctomycetales bacterium]|nr:hypothetical protein [Planctomycetales bacterium]
MCSCAFVAFSGFVHSPSVDECGHLAAGLSHHELGAFDLYAVNPPLVRLWATLPTTFMQPVTDWSGYTSRSDLRPEFGFGRRLVELNGERTGTLISIARLSCLPFFALGAIFCYRLAIRNGKSAAIAAGGLWLTSPLVLGFSAVITPDVASTAFGILATDSIARWSCSYSVRDCCYMAVCVSVTVLTKFTWIAVIPILLVLAVCFSRLRPATAKLMGHGLIAIVAFGILANVLYAWTDIFVRLDQIHFVSDTYSVPADALSSARRSSFSDQFVGQMRLPISAKIIEGVDIQKRDFERGFRSYLMGEWKHGGWWYYYLIGFLVKEPIGFQLMLYVSILTGLWNWKRWTKEGCREWWLIVLPPVLIFGLVSSQTGFNHHMRYVLPAYPFLFIIAARTVTLGKFWKWFSYACLTWQAAAVLWFAPHWMSYFNEAAGGPKNGHKWLVDSNIDWGQDILMLKWWQEKHPEAAPLNAAMFTMFDPKDIGLKFKLPAPFVKGQPGVVTKDGLRGPQPGWYALSVCMLKGMHFSVPEGDGEWS